MPTTPCQRLWIVGDCPPEINTWAPETYGPGCVALAFGATTDGGPPVAWFENLAESLGLSEAATATLCMRFVDAFCWTVFWDSSGQAIPPDPKIQEWPPQ